MAGPDGRLRPANLYRLTWNNPRPEAAIEYIRFSVKDGLPFLLGITVERAAH